MRGAATLLFLATHVPDAEATLSDPRYCYILDVFLLLYSIIFTALYLREKLTRDRPVTSEPTAAPTRNRNEPVYTDLDLPQVNPDYQQLDRRVRRREEETQYQELRGQSNDDYQRINIGTKPRKAKSKSQEARTGRNDAAEALEMYPLP